MATIIGALIATLGLDTKAYQAGVDAANAANAKMSAAQKAQADAMAARLLELVKALHELEQANAALAAAQAATTAAGAASTTTAANAAKQAGQAVSGAAAGAAKSNAAAGQANKNTNAAAAGQQAVAAAQNAATARQAALQQAIQAAITSAAAQQNQLAGAVNHAANTSANAFGTLQKRALSFIATLAAGGTVVKAFVNAAEQSNTTRNQSRLSGVDVRTTRAFDETVRAHGGAKGDGAADLANFANMRSKAQTGELSADQWNALQLIGVRDPLKATPQEIATKYAEYAKQHSDPGARNSGKIVGDRLGVSGGLYQAGTQLGGAGLMGETRERSANAPTDAETRNLAEMSTSLVHLGQSWDNAKVRILSSFAPALDSLFWVLEKGLNVVTSLAVHVPHLTGLLAFGAVGIGAKATASIAGAGLRYGASALMRGAGIAAAGAGAAGAGAAGAAGAGAAAAGAGAAAGAAGAAGATVPAAAAGGGILATLGRFAPFLARAGNVAGLGMAAVDNAKMTGGIISDIGDMLHGRLPGSLGVHVPGEAAAAPPGVTAGTTGAPGDATTFAPWRDLFVGVSRETHSLTDQVRFLNDTMQAFNRIMAGHPGPQDGAGGTPGAPGAGSAPAAPGGAPAASPAPAGGTGSIGESFGRAAGAIGDGMRRAGHAVSEALVPSAHAAPTGHGGREMPRLNPDGTPGEAQVPAPAVGAPAAGPPVGAPPASRPVTGPAGLTPSADHAAFIAKWGPQAQRIAAQVGTNPANILAHWAQETNWGQSEHDNNVGNLQAVRAGPNTTTRGDTHADGSHYQHAFFRYETPEDSANAYASWIVRHRAAGTAGESDSALEFGGRLRGAHYMENPNAARDIANTRRLIPDGALRPQVSPDRALRAGAERSAEAARPAAPISNTTTTSTQFHGPVTVNTRATNGHEVVRDLEDHATGATFDRGVS